MGNEPSTPSRHSGHAGAASSTFYKIADNFRSIEAVQAELRRAGLESSNLIVAIDYTKSNEWTGAKSFNRQCLHAINPAQPNPYESAVSIIGRTLAAFDDDNLIPSYGFGDNYTQDKSVFSFLPSDQPLHGMPALLERYRELTPTVKLAGPTSFAPAIRQAMRIVAQAGNSYHILLIVADGQVTRPSDTKRGCYSTQERETIDAIVAASALPLSIIMVGVGDGPWDVMTQFDDALPTRKFDNFQFVNFTDLLRKRWDNWQHMEATFALNALMEIPEQYKLIQKLGMLSAPVTPALRAAVARYPPPLDPPQPPALSRAQRSGRLSDNNVPTGPYPYAHAPGPYPYPAAGQAPYPAQAPGPYPYPAAGQAPYPAPYPAAGVYPSQLAAPPVKAPPSAPAAAASSSVPSLFICPITQELMRDPVLAADGYSYERTAIEQWFATHDTSPMTNMPISKNLTTNHALRSSILDHVAQGGK